MFASNSLLSISKLLPLGTASSVESFIERPRKINKKNHIRHSKFFEGFCLLNPKVAIKRPKNSWSLSHLVVLVYCCLYQCSLEHILQICPKLGASTTSYLEKICYSSSTSYLNLLLIISTSYLKKNFYFSFYEEHNAFFSFI